MMEACFVNDEKVQAQEGDFYGGWITSILLAHSKVRQALGGGSL